MRTGSRIGAPVFPDPLVGELDKRVQIRWRLDIPVGYAGVVEQRLDPILRWASLVPVGTAVWAATVQTDERITHRCLVRYIDGITNQHEIYHSGRVYFVRRAAPLRGKRKFLVLDLEEMGDGELI
ncbi:head-tail adaptor protein [Alcaligenes faecalis]|uniref:head-tail adaptor protein n=1 Tax=Alcaligenes faecalis TaxID=511 RepID=UPI00214F6D95|nr:head-tail adaptor protein [Alcaligenes faecalis]MCR4146651.1 head-tail adaptor protein [Alcaligenes faecalis]